MRSLREVRLRCDIDKDYEKWTATMYNIYVGGSSVSYDVQYICRWLICKLRCTIHK